MPKKKVNTKNKAFWFQMGLIGVLISAPNATIIKLSMNDIDPTLFNAIRFGIVGIILLPFIFRQASKITKLNLSDAIKAGIFMSIAVICYCWAVKLSQASYVSIIILLTPIVLIIYSAKMTGEKITSRSVAGITLAALGAMTIVLLPIALKQGGSFTFYPMATFLTLVNCAFFPLAIIYYRRANEHGMPMPTLIGVSSWVICALNILVFTVTGNHNTTLSKTAIVGILYSGIVVTLVARMLNVKSYEHVGSVISGMLWYIEVFFAVLIPVVFLHEKLSMGMVVGGLLILLGVYVVEHHKKIYHKHHFIFRTH